MSLLSSSFFLIAGMWLIRSSNNSEQLGDSFCSGMTICLNLTPLSGEHWGGDWENGAPHALFSSNPAIVSSGFSPGGLKRLEML